MSNCYFNKRFELVKQQEAICYKMLCNAGFFSGTDAIQVMDDYDVDLRNKYNNRRCGDIKIGRTIYIDPNNLMANEEQQYILKEKQFNKYCKLAAGEGDFFIYLFHLFFIDQAKLLTKRLQHYSWRAKNRNVVINSQVNCLPISVNYLKENKELCAAKIHLNQKIKGDYLKNPNSECGTLLKIDGGRIGTIVDLKRQFAMLQEEDRMILKKLP